MTVTNRRSLCFFYFYSPLVLDYLQPSTSGLVQLLPVWEERQSTGDDQHPQPGDDAPRRPVHGWWRYIQTLSWDSQWAIIQLCSNLSISAAEVVVSNLRRIRIRSNSTGAKHSSPKEPTAPRRFGNQLETPDKQRLSCGGKVPKSASISSLSLIITPGYLVTELHLKQWKSKSWWYLNFFAFCFRWEPQRPPAQSHLPSLPLLQPFITWLLPQPRPVIVFQQPEASHHHPNLREEIWLHLAGDQSLHGWQWRLYGASHGSGEQHITSYFHYNSSWKGLHIPTCFFRPFSNEYWANCFT